MKATRELIDALRVTADRIENGYYEFEWYDTEKCWCGCLAATLLNCSQSDIYEQLIYGGCWSSIAHFELKSNTTGLPLDVTVKALVDVGFETVEDFDELEFLGDETDDQKDKQNGINWMRRKADQLETQLLSQQAASQQTVTTQSVTVN